ncbi:MAG: hypothetical protein HYU58_05515 [Proteobacteria bacterium]|nr:hypothetical protein [Pseudomonadota bacterium]
MPIISHREVIAAWALIVLVGGILFGADFALRDTAASCEQHVVAPERHIPDASSSYDRGQRLERLDWDKDVGAGGGPASVRTADPCPL